MGFYVCSIKSFIIFSLFANTWGLKSESIIDSTDDYLAVVRDRGYYVTLFSVRTSNRNFLYSTCGAAIITAKLAVTAAHCLRQPDWKLTIFAVPPNLELPQLLEDEQNRKYYKITEVYVYQWPDWSEVDENIDIAVVSVNGKFEPSTFFPNARTIEFSKTKTSYAGVTNTVFVGAGENGLGYDTSTQVWTNRNGSRDFKLRESVQEVYKNGYEWNLTPLELIKCNRPQIICTATIGTKEPQGIIAPGDSGGPLIYNGKLIGIVSNGLAYSPNWKTITLFVNVAYHQDFLQMVMDGNIDPNVIELHKYELPSTERTKEFCRYAFTFQDYNNSLLK